MAKDKDAVERKRLFVRPPSNVKQMSDEELERWAEEAVLTLPTTAPQGASGIRDDRALSSTWSASRITNPKSYSIL